MAKLSEMTVEDITEADRRYFESPEGRRRVRPYFGDVERIIRSAAPTCTLWRWSENYYGWVFVLWPQIKLPHYGPT